MSRSIGQIPQPSITTQQPPVGGVADVMRSGDAYKAVGELVQRSIYTALSAAFPRNGSFSSVTGTLSTSLNGVSWNSIAYGNGVYVAVGPNSSDGATNIAGISYDGKNWTQIAMPSSQKWSSVTFGNGKFVAVSGGVGTGVASNAGAVSTDGVNWTTVTLSASAKWSAVIYFNSLFVAVAGWDTATNVAASSPDGVTWTARTMPSSSPWRGLAASGSLLAAIAGGSTAASSTNGTTWTARTVTGASSCQCISYGASTFVVAGSSAIYSSADLITWSVNALPTQVATIGSIAYGNGVFIGSPTASVGLVAVSYDGLSWKQYASGLSGSVQTVFGYGNGAFIALQPGLAQFATMYGENLTDSDYLYLTGAAGKFIRVK